MSSHHHPDPKIVFMGSPEFAEPSLAALSEQHWVVGVVTQPDQPAGRGQKLTSPPVKTLAEKLGLPIIQPQRLREPQAMEQLKDWAPDLIVVAAFGQILRREVLDLPQHGCINVHASLLPRWRGAAPVHAAILNGDPRTGVTIMLMDAGVDTGPILSQRSTPIRHNDTTGTLSARLATLGANLLMETLPGYLAWEIKPIIQDEAKATNAAMLKKEDGQLDFNQPAEALERKVRAFQPWPGAFTAWHDQPLKILKAELQPPIQPDPAVESGLYPGERMIWAGEPAIRALHGLLVLKEVQPAGKKAMTGRSFLQGARDWVG